MKNPIPYLLIAAGAFLAGIIIAAAVCTDSSSKPAFELSGSIKLVAAEDSIRVYEVHAHNRVFIVVQNPRGIAVTPQLQ